MLFPRSFVRACRDPLHMEVRMHQLTPQTKGAPTSHAVDSAGCLSTPDATDLSHSVGLS